MEPEIGAWSTLEYVAISAECAATGSAFYLTSVPASLAGDLPEPLLRHLDCPLKVTSTEVTCLPGIDSQRVCLLDPHAETELAPGDAGLFDCFVFGGILGWFFSLFA